MPDARGPTPDPSQGGASLCAWIYSRPAKEELARRVEQGGGLEERCVHTGRTPLMLCAQRGWAGLVTELLSLGADARAVDPTGRDALMLALVSRRVECARILAPVSNLRARDPEGRCALALAALHAPDRADAHLMTCLWVPGADRWVDAEGSNALDVAARHGMAAIGDLLMFKRSAIEARALGARRGSAPDRQKSAARL